MHASGKRERAARDASGKRERAARDASGKRQRAARAPLLVNRRLNPHRRGKLTLHLIGQFPDLLTG